MRKLADFVQPALTLNSTAFLIDANKNRTFRSLTNRFVQGQQLLIIVIVAGKQNYATDGWVLKNFSVFCGQFATFYINP